MLKKILIFFVLLPFLSCGGGKSELEKNINIDVYPLNVNFGTVDINSEDFRIITITHVGSEGTLHLYKVYLTDESSKEFSTEGAEKTSLEKGESTFVTIFYRPKDGVADNGQLIIEHNVPPNFKSVVNISALGQMAHLTTIPNPINFGEVVSGNDKIMDVRVKNIGADKIGIDMIYVKGGSDSDFSIENIAEMLPMELSPDGELYLQMKYSPKGGQNDVDYLVIKGKSKDVPVIEEFQIVGSEIGPEIVVSPGLIDFGYVLLNEKETKQIYIYNEGNYDLKVSKVYPSLGSDANIVVENFPEQGFVIAPDDNKVVDISWTPKELKPPSPDPIGWIVIESNDGNSPQIQIEAFGMIDSPQLIVTPSDTVDFGFVAQMITFERTVTLLNNGTSPLTVEAVELMQPISSEFEIKNDESFPPLSSSPAAGTIEAGEAKTITLSFTNKGAASGTETGKLKIKSNSPGKEEVILNLIAKRAGSPTCEILLLPTPSLDFGTIPKGFKKTMYMTLYNKGTGYCSFVDARIEECFSLIGMWPTCNEPTKGQISKIFQLLNKPPAIKDGIAPGAQIPLQVQFSPPKTAPIWSAIDQYFALLWVKVYNSYTKEYLVYPNTPQGGQFGSGYAPNIKGASGVAKVAVIPGEINFGVVTIGCCSKAQKVTLYNTGNAPLEVTQIAMKNCSPEFKTKNVPGLPKNVSAGAPLPFEVTYCPLDLGIDTCVLEIKSSDESSSVLSVSLSGEGTYETEQTDIFKQVSGQEVDVLFIIDDSGSMCEEQDRLASSFNEFIKYAKVWDNDYHIGIISVNVVKEEVMGKLNLGKKTPRYLTPSTPDVAKKFEEFVKLGCGGGSDPQESGLAATQVALSAPLISETGVSCSSDDQCKNDKNLCADAVSCPYYCIDGSCSGWNVGFMRDTAQLELIVLSDEEDQSPAAVSFYIDFLKNIKGFYNENLMNFNAIVGPQGGCTAPDGGTADAGKRYIQTAQETGGKIGSICDASYAPILNDIGAQAFGLKVQFFLSRVADPPTIKVWVNGKDCASGWTFDAPSNSVIFDEKGSCMPQPGDEIKVHYKTLCLQG